MSCLLGSLLNKGRRPLRSSAAGAASSEAEATAAFTEFALFPVSAAESSLFGTLRSFGEGLSVPDSAELALSLACVRLVFSPPSLSFPAALWGRGWMVIGQRVGAPAALFGSP